MKKLLIISMLTIAYGQMHAIDTTGVGGFISRSWTVEEVNNFFSRLLGKKDNSHQENSKSTIPAQKAQIITPEEMIFQYAKQNLPIVNGQVTLKIDIEKKTITSKVPDHKVLCIMGGGVAGIAVGVIATAMYFNR